ncbi:MAG TPA: helix-turn-helix transcriptional regulator [Chitinophagaceae bacterium]|nr:helix-turn-helix transcriptional regulator [Chitinophagaceae bacterium]
MIDIKTFAEYPDIDKPKRLRKYVLIWCSKGTAIVVVDEKELSVKQNHILTITSGQIHFFKKKEKAEGLILEFTYDFFCKNDSDIELIFLNGLFCHFDLNEVITVPAYKTIETQLGLIKQELQTKPYQYLITIHSRIELILVEINRAKVKRGDEIWKPDALFLKFLESVRANFEHNYPLSRFAKMLGTTEAKLNEQSKLHTGRTAQNVIYGLIASEAKRLLIYQNLSVKEVAYQLGFNDPFYFSNFFKKHASVSPKIFQDKYAL